MQNQFGKAENRFNLTFEDLKVDNLYLDSQGDVCLCTELSEDETKIVVYIASSATDALTETNLMYTIYNDPVTLQN